MIHIYTDGGCTGNPGPGGWAAVILAGNDEICLSGGDASTTNNKMELTAVIKALEEAAKKGLSGQSITIHTDSQYVKNGITSWIKNWIKNGWKTAAKKPVKNKDLWIQLQAASAKYKLSWKWVKGHSGNHYNELCDSLVEKERMRFK